MKAHVKLCAACMPHAAKPLPELVEVLCPKCTAALLAEADRVEAAFKRHRARRKAFVDALTRIEGDRAERAGKPRGDARKARAAAFNSARLSLPPALVQPLPALPPARKRKR